MTDDPKPPRPGNRVFTGDEMRQAFGPHPMAGWKPAIRKGHRRTWMKKSPGEDPPGR